MRMSCFAVGKGKEKTWLKEGLVYSLLWKYWSLPSESYEFTVAFPDRGTEDGLVARDTGQVSSISGPPFL